MSVTADTAGLGHKSSTSWLWQRQLGTYPDTRPRMVYLAITVLATIMLYYELYVAGAVSTLILSNLHASFNFFVYLLAFGNLIGAFGALLAGITDRLGRANLVVGGLLITGIMTAFVLPNATNKWAFGIEGFAVGLVEGICLVATPALIRDFSPQMGRATAMGFWTVGPVAGSLIVAVVGSATIPAVVTNDRIWTHQYVICGIAGLVVFLIALVGLRELSPRLRDQLMVSIRDRALIEARAKGLDVEAALRHPFRQLLKADIIVSAFAVSVMLLIYYTAVGFSLIYLTTVFGFSVKDGNGLGNWNWGFNVIAVLLVGIVSDRFRVRKPFMVIGGVIAAVMVVVYLEQAGHHPGYYTLALLLAGLSLGLGIAFAPWMASFTETVEARNPALTATGLAIWGWIQRLVVFASFLIIPAIVSSVTPLVSYGSTVQAYATQYASQLAFAQAHPAVVADAQKVPPSVIATATAIPPDGDRHRGQDPAGGAGHRHHVQHPAGERGEVRAGTGRDPGQPGAVHQAERRPHQHDPAGAGRRRRGRRGQGRRRARHDRRQPGRDQRRHRGRPAAADGRTVRGRPDHHRTVLGAAEDHRAVLGRADGHGPVQRAADGAVQGAADGDRLPHRPRLGRADGRRQYGGSVEDLVLDLLRRNHRLPAVDTAAARPVAPADAKRDEEAHEAMVQAELAKLNG